MKNDTTGFGCPNEIDPAHFSVSIPRLRNSPVTITEHYGLKSGRDGLPEKIERVSLPRPLWRLIAPAAKAVLNDRLKSKKIKGGDWKTGNNKVERMLGKELMVLVWAVELADTELVLAAIKNWAGLKPEERWWLFTMTAAATGRTKDGDKGWRKALRHALTENPT